MAEKNVQILIIDDEPMIRDILSAFLKQWGYVSFAAENGRAGIEVFQREKIDLVLTDLDMPVMSGVEVLAYIHEHSPDTPVIIISGAGQLDDAVKSVKFGAWDYLTKPISNMAILENTIFRCLEKVRLIRENRMYQQHLEEEVASKTVELRQKNIALEAEVAERKHKEDEVRRLNTRLEAIVDVSGQLFGYSTMRELLQGVLYSMHWLLRCAPAGEGGSSCIPGSRRRFCPARQWRRHAHRLRSGGVWRMPGNVQLKRCCPIY